jgi:hypothetical protein
MTPKQAALPKHTVHLKKASEPNTQRQPNGAQTQRELAVKALAIKRAYELGELTELGYGSRSYLYLEIGEGRLRAVKRGRRTIVLVDDLNEWLDKLPEAENYTTE